MQDFFKTMAPIAEQTDITIHIKAKGGIVSVMIIPKASVKDATVGNIKPLQCSGTAEELDSGFLALISAPLQETAGIISNIADYEKQNGRLASDNVAAKTAQAAENKAKSERRAKYDDLMVKVKKYQSENNYAKAEDLLKSAVEYAENPTAHKKLIDENAGKMTSGSLFDEPAVDETTETKEEE